jgi:epoxyqueuosine reductase
MTDLSISDRIEALARAEGFDLAGMTSLDAPPDAGRFEEWLDGGFHGQMDYLERYRPRIVNPQLVAPGAKSVVCVGVRHARPPGGFRGGGRVARYALGRDYHHVLDRMLRALARRIEGEGIARVVRTVVDAGPVLERSLAARAGLGFPSKSANLLHHRLGPWFFLGELFLDREVESSPKRAPGSCGTCVLCIERCPTGAISPPGRVDARVCISYLTIEHRGPIPEELRPKIGEWVFGCDVCSEVCPFGDEDVNVSSLFGTHGALAFTLEDLVALDEERFRQAFTGSPMRRAKREGLARNACIVLGNLRRVRAADALAKTAKEDPSPVVRDAAAWALTRL